LDVTIILLATFGVRGESLPMLVLRLAILGLGFNVDVQQVRIGRE
jgi:hypothetical protein